MLMRGLLAADGIIYVHCDWRVNAFIRLALDEIFGAKSHVNQLQWCYSIGGKGKNRFARKHDTIYFIQNLAATILTGSMPM
jgi:adenine specific DNA methylase Mod